MEEKKTCTSLFLDVGNCYLNNIVTYMIFRVKQENKYSTFKVKAWATQGSVLWSVFYLLHTTNAKEATFGTQPYFAICKSIEELTRENPIQIYEYTKIIWPLQRCQISLKISKFT